MAGRFTFCVSRISWSWLVFCLLTGQMGAQEKTKKSNGLTDPYVAWAEGQEVEIRFHLHKIEAIGLSLKDLEVVKYMRFWGENWTRTIKDVKVDLKKVTELKFRALHLPPFTVKLLDGREAVITPVGKEIAAYMVPGEHFQRDVLRCLNDPILEDPVKATVMRGIIVFGNVPHSTGADKVHRSLGDSLDRFARVELRGRVGPQATELSRMRVAYQTALEAKGHSHGTSRELIEKRFGPGKPTDPKMPDGPRQYSFRNGGLEVHWTEDGKSVDYMYALHGKEFPTAKADEPEKLANQAHELADAYRAFVLEYFSRMHATLEAGGKQVDPGITGPKSGAIALDGRRAPTHARRREKVKSG